MQYESVSEAYSEPSQTTKMELFVKMVKAERLKPVNYFRKKLLLRCSTVFWIHL